MTVNKLASTLLALLVLASLVVLSPGHAAAATITGISATASSTWGDYESVSPPGYQPEFIVDGSGLNYGGSLGAHDIGDRYAHWLDGSAKASKAGDTDPYVVFDLGGQFKVGEVRIWNYNGTTKRGVKGLDILGSPDNVTYTLMKTVEVNEAPGDSSYDFSQTFSGLYNASNVRYVKFDILSNQGGSTYPGEPLGDGGYGFAALSEVQLDGTSAPLITGVTATASSSWEFWDLPSSYGADHLVDGSGLDHGGVPGAHDTDGRYDMWLSGTAKTNYAGDTDPYVVFDLGQIFDMQAVRIWDYNPDHVSKYRGAKGLDILGSADGVSYTLMKTIELDEAPGSSLVDFSQTFSGLANTWGVRYVMFDFLSNHNGAIFPTDGSGGSAGANANGFVGLSEVQFYGLVIPEPSTLVLAVLGIIAVAACRRRQRK